MMPLQLWARLGWRWRRFWAIWHGFEKLGRRFGYRTSLRAHAAWIRCRYLSADRNGIATVGLGTFGTVQLRLGTSDWGVLHQILVNEEYDSGSASHEAALRRFYESVCASGKTPLILDCGANIGMASLWYASRYPRAQVIAVEPEPANFALLKANTEQRPTIVPVMAAVWDRQTRVDLTDGGTGPVGWRTRQNDSGELLTVTVPALVRRFPDRVPMIVKIDIEGAEVELFRSNTDWTEVVPLIAFEPHDWLMPWRGTFQSAISVLVRSPRDYLVRGETFFAFSHRLRDLNGE